MNWAEQLRLIYRLTKQNTFGFGAFCVTYDYIRDEFIYWDRQSPGLRVGDAELVSIIASYGEVVLERVSGREHFRFSFTKGELRVHVVENPYFPFWLPDALEGSRYRSEAELGKMLNGYRNVVLLEAP